MTRLRSRYEPGGIFVESCDDRPYGPGQSDYEYDRHVQRKIDMEPKLCKDCRHYRAEGVTRSLDKCLHPRLAKAPDLVRGEAMTTYCDAARNDGFNSLGECGSAGKLWEAP